MGCLGLDMVHSHNHNGTRAVADIGVELGVCHANTHCEFEGTEK